MPAIELAYVRGSAALSGQSPLVPLSYDVVWLLVGILWLLIPVVVGVAERRRGASWADTLLWFLVTLLVPIVGLIIWAVYRAARAKRQL